MKARFKLDKSDRFKFSESYFTNGHWLVSRASCLNAPKHLYKQLQDLSAGIAIKSFTFCDDISDTACNQVIPRLESCEYVLDSSPCFAVMSERGMGEIDSFVYKATKRVDDKPSEIILVAVNPNYAQLMNWDGTTSRISSPTSPILVSEENGTTVAVVMPMRMHKGKYVEILNAIDASFNSEEPGKPQCHPKA